MSLRNAPFFCALFALGLYLFTLAPTIGWGDSADIAMRMAGHNSIFANSSRDYVLYRTIGVVFQALPIGDAGTRANIMAAFFGAVTVGLVAFSSGFLTRNIYAAFAAGIALTVSHTFWLMSVTAEVYTFSTALVFACYALVALWWRTAKTIYLVSAFLCAGLALSHHVTGFLLAATIAPLVLLRIRKLPIATLAICICVFLLTSFIYWKRSVMWLLLDAPFAWALGLYTPANAFFSVSPPRELLKFIAYAGYNFFGVGLPLAALGLFVAWREKIWEMLPALLWFLLIVFLGTTSSIPDKFNIYVLCYPVLAICIGLGVGTLRNKLTIAALLSLAIIPPIGYVATINATKLLGIDLVGARTVPYRDNAWYFMWPSKRGDFGPRKYAEEALKAVDKDAVLIADYTLWQTLYFMQAVEWMRPDVKLVWVEPLLPKGVAHYIAQLPAGTPVFLAINTPPQYYQLAEIQKRYSLKQKGVVFKVIRPAP